MATFGTLKFQPRTVKYIARRYRNSAVAIKELVANAWDADATRVDIRLPLFLEGTPILVIDNGHGMTARELKSLYLPVGADRRTSRPETRSGRKVKGRLGFGKLAGLQFASRMTVRTVSRGVESCLVLDEDDLTAIDDSGKDVANLKIEIISKQIGGASGTTVELSRLRPGLEQPDPKQLRSLLLREFGLRSNFQIFIDGQQIVADDIEGEKLELQLRLPDGTTPQLIVRFLPPKVSVADTGVSVSVDGRVLDRPPDFGLRDNLRLPREALRRIVIEVDDDGLIADVTSDWSSVVEDSEHFQALRHAVNEAVTERVLQRLEDEAPESAQQLVERYERQLELIPFSERERARQALYAVFRRIFAEIPELRTRRDTIANLVIDMFREDRYWLVARRLKDIGAKDLITLSEVLSDWGLGNLAEITSRAKARLEFLDSFTQLILTKTTGEFKGVHPVLKNNPWLFGDEYELMFSNRQINTIVEKIFGTAYQGDGGKDRPDFVLDGPGGRLLIVELKSPQDTFDWNNEGQIKRYMDRLAPSFSGRTMSGFMLAGKAPMEMKRNLTPGIKLLTYEELAADAEARLQWLIKNIDLSPLQPDAAQPDLGI